MAGMLITLWTVLGLAVAGGSTQTPPGMEPIAAIPLEHVPASATHRPKGDGTRQHPVEARLLFDSSHAVPGQTLRVGVHLTQDAGWHTYWKSPGAVGLPTDITWSVPDGATTTPYQYPVPSRFELEGLVSFGYDDQILLYTELTLPEDQAEGSVTIGAEVAWLVCEVQCIRGTASLKRTLDVRQGPDPQPSFTRPLFDAFESQHPGAAADVEGLDTSVSFEPAELPKEGSFTATIMVSGAQLEVPEGTALWPTFTPFYQGDGWILQMGTTDHDGGRKASFLWPVSYTHLTLPTICSV